MRLPPGLIEGYDAIAHRVRSGSAQWPETTDSPRSDADSVELLRVAAAASKMPLPSPRAAFKDRLGERVAEWERTGPPIPEQNGPPAPEQTGPPAPEQNGRRQPSPAVDARALLVGVLLLVGLALLVGAALILRPTGDARSQRSSDRPEALTADSGQAELGAVVPHATQTIVPRQSRVVPDMSGPTALHGRSRDPADGAAVAADRSHSSYAAARVHGAPGVVAAGPSRTASPGTQAPPGPPPATMTATDAGPTPATPDSRETDPAAGARGETPTREPSATSPPAAIRGRVEQVGPLGAVPVPEVSILLLAARGDCLAPDVDSPTALAVSDANGNYEFAAVPAGDYWIAAEGGRQCLRRRWHAGPAAVGAADACGAVTLEVGPGSTGFADVSFEPADSQCPSQAPSDSGTATPP